jgi:hypothetical protein
MNNSQKRYFDASFELPNPGLKAFFIGVEEGQSKVYDTPFARGESTSHLLKAWQNELKSIRSKWPSLWEFEIDLAKKVGPMSVRKPLSQRMDDIDSYYDGILLPSTRIDEAAIRAVQDEWDTVRPVSVRSVRDTWNLMKKSTNSGSPYFMKRRRADLKTFPIDDLYATRGMVFQKLQGRNYNAAAILGWRGQEGGPSEEDAKQRVVWMFPMALNILELSVYQPLVEAAQKFDLVPAWVSMESVDRHITSMFDTKGADDLVVCTDFSKFDQHFNQHLQDSARSTISYLLNRDGDSENWLNDIFPIKYMIPLAYDWEKVRFGLHGMGSGSGGTNCDETLAHRSLQYEVALRHGAKLNPHSQCLGDDGILTYPGITVDDVVKAYTSHGLDMNQDKQYASTQDCTYLRRWHHKDYRVGGVCVGVYSTCRALGRLRYLERFQDPRYWNEKMVALRQLSILENVKWHPLREEFVRFCMKRDKYRLGVDIPGFLSNIRKEAQKANDHMPDYIGYTKSLQTKDPVGGIDQWWIVKFLKSIK